MRAQRPRRPAVDLEQLPPEERQVVAAAAHALGERRVRWTDRRLLIIFLLLVGIVAYLANDQRNAKHEQRNFVRVERGNCQSLNATIVKIDRYSDRQAASVRHRTDLSPAVKAQTLKNLTDFRIPLQVCP